jgi:hypothetical protein
MAAASRPTAKPIRALVMIENDDEDDGDVDRGVVFVVTVCCCCCWRNVQATVEISAREQKRVFASAICDDDKG